MDFPKYLSVKEVAAILNISVKTIYKKREYIPGCINLDGMYLFDAEELLKGLKAKTSQPNKTASKIHQNRTDDRHGLMK